MAQDKPLQQKKKAAQLMLLKQQVSIQHCLHVLNVLNDWSQLWPKLEFKQIRESVSFIPANADLFPSIAGDNIPDAHGPATFDEPHGNAPSLTKTNVSCLAKYCSVNEDAFPIFQVVSLQKKFKVSMALSAGKNSINVMHICILDGSGDGMVCCLNMNLAHDGSKLCAETLCSCTRSPHSHMLHQPEVQDKSTSVKLQWLTSTTFLRLDIMRLHIQLLIR